MSTKPLILLVTILPLLATCGRASAGERPAQPVEVSIHHPAGWQRRESLLPGEWVSVYGREHSFGTPYRGGTDLRFELDWPRLFVRTDGAEPRLEGVRVEGPAGRAAAQKAIADKVNPLTLSCSSKELDALPPVPETIDLALWLEVGDDFDMSLLAAKFPGLRALCLSPKTYHAPADRLRGLNELSRLTSLHIGGFTIEDLGPLARLTQLTALHVTWQGDQAEEIHPAMLREMGKTGLKPEKRPICPKDLAPLAGLSELRSLTLEGALDASDLRPLAKLTKLTCLSLAYCRNVTDLGPLAELSNLAALKLEGLKNVSDLSPLARLRNLADLHLTSIEKVSDLTPIAGIDGLRRLGIGDDHDLPPLRNLGKLEELRFGARTQAGLEALRGLANLKLLYVGTPAQGSDLSPLGTLSGLKELCLDVNKGVSDLAPLAKLAALEKLIIVSSGNVADLAPLGKLSSLTCLELYSFHQVRDLGPLGQLSKLERLKFHDLPQAADFSPLGKLTHLRELLVWDCGKAAGIEPLHSLTGLTYLSLRGFPEVTDLAPLASLRSLTVLGLSGFTKIADLAPLAKLGNLTSLYLTDFTKATDLGPLGALGNLRHLGMERWKEERWEGVKSLKPLAALANLESFCLRGCARIPDLRPLADLPRLADVDLLASEGDADLRPLRGVLKRGGKVSVDSNLERQLQQLRAEQGP